MQIRASSAGFEVTGNTHLKMTSAVVGYTIRVRPLGTFVVYMGIVASISTYLVTSRLYLT